MAQVKIGLIREGKVPVDHRVPLTPGQVAVAKSKYSDLDIVVQKSDVRCFSDEDYKREGIKVVDNLEDCDVILGVKEVPIPHLIPEKTYFFFSHTIKKQPYNRGLLQEILKKRIRLIDYETLTNETGQRVIAFGRWAGIVGAYNGIWTYGKRHKLFDLRRAHECFDLEDLKTEFDQVKLPAIKILLTGGGRVAKGAIEILDGLGIKQISPVDFLEKEYDHPVYAQLSDRDYNRRKTDGGFDLEEYFQRPGLYESTFLRYTKKTDVLIAAAFWHPQAPVLFTKSDMLDKDFRIKVIADITCDIEGSIPSTKKASTIADPIYDYNPSNNQVETALSSENNVTVMAVDNLPCELPRDASESFGDQLVNNVLPSLLGKDEEGTIKRATIAENGKLKERYSYLQDYVDGKNA